MRTMYDGVNVTHLPAGGTIYAGYVDGAYINVPQIVKRFPGKLVLGIAVHPTTNNGIILDAEPGNCVPSQVPGWVTLRRNAGVNPTVYCGQNTWWATIKKECTKAGIAQPNYWVANYNGKKTIPAGSIAHQYEDNNTLYDASVVASYWPGVDPAPVVNPPKETTNMVAHDPISKGYWVLFPDGHIECYGGAPYLGAPNHHAGTWSMVGTPMGFAAAQGSTGSEGYVIVTELASPNPNGTWCNSYLFPRNGSEL